MAQQGLFTQGTSVQDLMADRRQRGTDLQNMLMQQAAQGARNPVRAQGASMLGSILGRSLAGAMGGQDTEMEKLTAKNAQRSEGEASRGPVAHASLRYGRGRFAGIVHTGCRAKWPDSRHRSLGHLGKSEDDGSLG